MRQGLVVFVLLVCLAGIIVLANDVTHQIDRGATATADAMEWTLAQTDVELLALDLAVHGAIESQSGLPNGFGLAEVRKRFDVFFSRVATLGIGSSFAGLREDPEFSEDYRQIKDFLASCAPIVDSPDRVLQSKLRLLHEKIEALRPISHEMTLAGLRTFAAKSQANRLQVEQTLLMAAALTVVFILTLLILVFVLLRLDRTNRARTAEAESSAARLAAIVGTAQDAVITVDPSGKIVDCNSAAELMLGHGRAQMLGHGMAELLAPPDQQPLIEAALDEALARQGPRLPVPELKRARVTVRSRRGQLFPVELTASATAEEPRLIVAFLRDLTDEVAAEAALVQARDEALAGERAKAEVLAVMSHEVRTPLNGLLGTLELLGETRLDARQKEYLRILETSGQLLLNHVNDVLDIARLDAGLMPRSDAVVDLRALAQELVENQRAAAERQGNRLEVETPGPAEGAIRSDARLLRRVLLNLLGNAVKFTEGGRITLSIRHLGPDGPTEFRISDTGVGIPAEDLPRIFDDFVTLDASYARESSGTGLGLGIARRIVTQLGGTLKVDSVPGAGSTFYFAIAAPILPSASVEAPAADPCCGGATGNGAEPGPTAQATGSEPGTAGLDILVVEDNEINRLVLRDVLARAGHRVTEAVDGADGLRLADARRFDVILMDISMPRMDGMQATEALRMGQGPNRATPVIALTAHALPEERKRFRSIGMSDVLTKPYGAEVLEAALRRAIEGGTPRQRGTNVQPFPPSRKARPPKALQHLVPAFLAEGDQSLAKIAGLTGDPAKSGELAAAVHRLAGSAGLIGAEALARMLARIETALKAGDLAAALADCQRLPDVWAETRAEMLAATTREPASPAAGA